MHKNPNKDDTFNAFMAALGFTWVDDGRIAPSHHYWTHKELKFTLCTRNHDSVEYIIAEYTRRVKAHNTKMERQAFRDCMFQFMGLTTSDLYSGCDRQIASNVVKVDDYG